MASLNKVFIMGNLTRDPELRRTNTGLAICRMALAVNRRYTTAQGETRDESCFLDVDVWGRTGELCAQNLRKGSAAFVEGRLRMDQWDDKTTGQKRSRLVILAENVQFIGARVAQVANQNPFATNAAPVADSFGASSASAAMPEPPDFEPIPMQDEDIPF